MSVMTTEKREAIAKNVIECPSSLQLVQQLILSHTLTYCAHHFTACPQRILIQKKLKPTDTLKRAEFCRWLKLGPHDVWYLFVMFDAWMYLKRFVESDSYTWCGNAPVRQKNLWCDECAIYYTYFCGWKFERSRIELKFQFGGPALLG